MKIKLLSLALIATLAAGCATEQGTHTAVGTGTGAVVGAGVGDLIGRDQKSTAIGAAVGAAVRRRRRLQLDGHPQQALGPDRRHGHADYRAGRWIAEGRSSKPGGIPAAPTAPPSSLRSEACWTALLKPSRRSRASTHRWSDTPIAPATRTTTWRCRNAGHRAWRLIWPTAALQEHASRQTAVDRPQPVASRCNRRRPHTEPPRRDLSAVCAEVRPSRMERCTGTNLPSPIHFSMCALRTSLVPPDGYRPG